MSVQNVSYNHPPEPGDEYVFSVTIDFDGSTGSPSRALRAMADYADAFQAIDAACAIAIDPGVESHLSVVRFENGSLRTVFASLLKSVDDEALKQLDWKRIIGGFLVRAKQLALRWLESADPDKTLAQLQEDIQADAASTELRYIPAYAQPNRSLLIDGLRKAQNAKDELEISDIVVFSSPAADLTLDMTRRTDLTKVADVHITDTQHFALEKINLTVKKPDMLGHSQWQMKLGQRTVRASIEDGIWLNRYQSRDIVLKPGDALKCDADYSIMLDSSGSPVGEKIDITKVYGVEYQPPGQQPLL